MSQTVTKVSFREIMSTARLRFRRDPDTTRAQLEIPVILFACFVGLLITLAAYFVDRNGYMDELLFYNPSYMLAHYGKLTLPSYPYHMYFDGPVITHPPVHTALIGLLCRMGFTWYYAEATPTFLLLLLAITAIVRSKFPSTVKLGLLFGIGFLTLLSNVIASYFGTRPEGEIQAAWLAGLVLLESARLDRWSPGKLLMGAFFLTWAAGLHYYAAAGFLGVAVYTVAAIRDLGWKAGKSRVAALCAGGCLFGLPYLAFYVIPYFHQIWTAIRVNHGAEGIGPSVRAHLATYAGWSHDDSFPMLIRRIFALRVPLTLWSIVILSSIRSTRILVFASLPLQLSIVLLASHKLAPYYLHEIGFFAGAAAIGILVFSARLWKRMPARFQKLFLPAAALLLAVYLIRGNPVMQGAHLSVEPHLHEGDVARAATRSILGPDARVTGRMGAWYTSGAESWWDLEEDMFATQPYDPAVYFENFDAAVEYNDMSGVTPGGSISGWYSSGVLQLRGFYIGETNPELRLVLLSTHRTTRIVGYAVKDGNVYRFDEWPGGDYEVISATCPASIELDDTNWIHRWEGAYSAVLRLPNSSPDAPGVVVTVLSARKSSEPAGWIAKSCKKITRYQGNLSWTDRKALIASLRRDDKPMKFYRHLSAMPGYIGVGLVAAMKPPAGGGRLNHVLDLSMLHATTPNAQVERTPNVRITTPSGVGSFAATIPLTHADLVSGPCWIQLRLRVIEGKIGFALYNERTGIRARTPAPVLSSTQPLDAVLKVDNLRDGSEIIIFNDNQSRSTVDVLDATVLIK